MGMVIKSYRLFIFVIVTVIHTPALAGDLNALYHHDYDGFWKHWNEVKSESVSCIDEHKTKLFLSDAISMLGNSEVTEANASVVERIALNNPKCLLTAMNQMEIEKQEGFIKSFLFRPLYNDAESIERSLSRVWEADNYKDSKNLFMKLKGI